MPLKKREPDIVDRFNRGCFTVVVAGLLCILMLIVSLIPPSAESLQEKLRPAVRAVLDYRKQHGRLPASLENAGLTGQSLASYDHGWNHSLKREVFTIGGGGRLRVVWYESERGWFMSTGGPASLFAPTEP